MKDIEKAENYYKCALRRVPPKFVPKSVLVLSTVHGDGPFHDTRAGSGVYECHSNRFGAISIKATNGRTLGLRPIEFEVVEWRENHER